MKKHYLIPPSLCFVRQICAVNELVRVAHVLRVLHVACHVAVVDVPGHVPAGDAHEEVAQLAEYIREREQGQLEGPASRDRELPLAGGLRLTIADAAVLLRLGHVEEACT